MFDLDADPNETVSLRSDGTNERLTQRLSAELPPPGSDRPSDRAPLREQVARWVIATIDRRTDRVRGHLDEAQR